MLFLSLLQLIFDAFIEIPIDAFDVFRNTRISLINTMPTDCKVGFWSLFDPFLTNGSNINLRNVDTTYFFNLELTMRTHSVLNHLK